MNKLKKVINKFNGNLCFVGNTESGDIIFECDRQNNILSYSRSSKTIEDICLNSKSSYLVAFGDEWLGLFSGNTLNEEYINTGINSVDRVQKNSSGSVYVVNSVDNQLIKITINN